MKTSQTYDDTKNDPINRANMARICSEYFGIKDVSPSLYKIAAPVSEISYITESGNPIFHRTQIKNAIPCNERSMKTFGVVYTYEATASFIGKDGKTYIVPNDQPVLDHLRECGYVIAPYGKNLDGTIKGNDSLIFNGDSDRSIFSEDFDNEKNIVDRNLPADIVQQIDEMEKGRPYYEYCEPYADTTRFGGTFALLTASENEIRELSLSERKIANITTYGRVRESMDIEEYVNRALKNYYLNDANFTDNVGVGL